MLLQLMLRVRTEQREMELIKQFGSRMQIHSIISKIHNSFPAVYRNFSAIRKMGWL